MKKLRKQPFKPGDRVKHDDYDEIVEVVSCEEGNFGSGWGVVTKPALVTCAGDTLTKWDAHWFTLAP